METFSKLSGPAKAGVGAGAAGGLLAVGVMAGTGKWIFILVLAGLLAVLVGGLQLFNWLKKRKRSAGFTGGLGDDSKTTPRGLSDPGQRARLDDLRKKFEQGIHEYRSRGKDLYTLPWYAIVGEPGSGKTEAIRHSNVGFPPGMQDEFQGVGGTINMNWWFTNNAVLLDTAGRLMFEELKPGETSEWREFLLLLKKYRPDCPINGLFLVIPSDTLIKDTTEEIAAKAGKVARQLNVIQGTLGVRFPVFVVVTKCDKINGFREYFDGLTDPQLQHQMLGWANPDPLDSPFRPELVDQHLETVAQRLRRRRLGLMRDPVPEIAEARRTDEVDALYALPHSFKLLAPRLRRYLETVFTGGEWTSSPLFLRGIYFTSAMREGAALDEDLARAIGVPVDQLVGGKDWERERAFFLRDLFLEKVFREKGLVTRVKDTGRMLRQRRLVLFSAVSIGLLLFLAVAYFSMRNLKDSVESRKKYWGTVSSVGWTNKTWLGSIIPVLPNDTYADYATNLVRVENTRESLGNFHRRLREQVEEPMPSSWLFPGVSRAFRKDSQLAQRIVFENGVIKPLLEATRGKMTRDLSRDSRAQEKLPEALATLVRLEADLVGWSKGTARSSVTPEEASKFLATLLDFATTNKLKPDTNLIETFVRTYAAGKDGDAAWPPAWSSGARGAGPHFLTNNPALHYGLDQLLGAATNGIQAQLGAWQQTDALRAALLRFKEAEDAMTRDAQTPGEAGDAGFLKQLGIAAEAKSAIDAEIERTRALPFFQGGLLMTSAYEQFKSNALAGTARMLATIGAEVDKALTLQAAKTTPVFPEIRQRLDKLRFELGSRVAGLDALADPARLRTIDEALFPGYAERGEVYRDLLKAMEAKPYGSTPLLGSQAEPLDTFLKGKVVPLRDKSTPYLGQRKKEFALLCRFGAELAERMQRKHFMQAYLKEAESTVANKAAFPLVRNSTRPPMKSGDVVLVTRSVRDIMQDLKSAAFQQAPFKDDRGWGNFTEWAGNLDRVSKAIMDPESKVFRCKISLMGIGVSSVNPDDNWRLIYRDVVFEADASTKPVRTGEVQDMDLGTIGLDQVFNIKVFPRLEVPPEAIFRSGEWGTLAWLHSFSGRKADDSRGDAWLVRVPIKPDLKLGDGFIRLRFRFDSPLPDVSAWPGPIW